MVEPLKTLTTLAYLARIDCPNPEEILEQILDINCGCTINGIHIKPHFRERIKTSNESPKPSSEHEGKDSRPRSYKTCIHCSRWAGMSAYPNNGVWEDEDEICVNPSIHEILQSPLGKSKLCRNRNNYYIKTGPKWHYRNKKLIGIWRS